MDLIYGPFNLGFEILTHSPDEGQLELYNRTYQLWKSVWTERFKEASINDSIDGDKFHLMQQLCVVHSHKQPLALIGIRTFNLHTESSLETAYINSLCPEMIQQLHNRNIFHVSGILGLTIPAPSRKSSIHFSLKDLAGSLVLRTARSNGCQAAIAYTRNDRGINKLFERFGAEALVKDQYRFDGPVDMLYLTWEKFKETDAPGVGPLADRLWNASQKRRVKIEAA